MKTILGIDPGFAATGYGVITHDGRTIRHVAHGVIRTDNSATPGKRLLMIFDAISDVIHKHGPDEAGVETLYFAKNASSALPVAQARGVVLLALARSGITAAEYPPQAIKQAIVGQGRADKDQVQNLIRMLLGLAEIPRPDHAADALGAAICHANTGPFHEKTTLRDADHDKIGQCKIGQCKIGRRTVGGSA